ncbi:class I SAM-dependent methyltransferase [Candidatus Kaiserbacteria bacterium]|nr:class I SAM-dependent methyltransferase [Candidatus Kaiserbacteria bacterium]
MCVQNAVFNEKTQLEFVIFSRAFGCKDRAAWQGVTQEALDRRTAWIMERVVSEDISEHMNKVYERTAEQCAANQAHQFVIPELFEFVSLFNDGELVLDMGCGNGRDAFFMCSSDQAYRASVMRSTVDPSTMPTQALRVKAIDASAHMIKIAERVAKRVDASGAVRLRYPPIFKQADMHDMSGWARLQQGWFAGVWSCASFLTHTPRQWIEPTLRQIACLLKRGGIFAVSYTQRQRDGGYDHLKISSTGEINYFSHPDPSEICKLAAKCGLLPIRPPRTSDYVGAGGDVVQDLFVTQFFRKEM